MRAGPQATSLSRQCTERPELFYVPRGPTRRLQARGSGSYTTAHGGVPLPGGRGTRPVAAPPLCQTCFCGRGAQVSGVGVNQKARGPGRLRPGTPGTYWGGAGERARGGPGFCCHGRGQHRAQGEGGVSLSSRLLLGRNRVPVRQVCRSVDLVDAHLAHTRLWRGFFGDPRSDWALAPLPVPWEGLPPAFSVPEQGVPASREGACGRVRPDAVR